MKMAPLIRHERTVPPTLIFVHMFRLKLQLSVRVLLMTMLVWHSPAQAAQWIHFSTWHDGTLSYLDAKSLILKGDRRIAWTRIELPAPTNYNGGLLIGWVAKVEVNCQARTQRTLSETGYQPDGSMLYQFLTAQDVVDVIPDSLGEQRWEALCSQNTKTRRK